MKKFLKIVLIIFVLLIGAAILVPYLFKDRLVQLVKDNVNASLDATVDFGDTDLSVFRDFPDFNFRVEDISVDGIGRFDSLRLAFIEEAAFSLDIMTVIKGEKIKIQGVSVDGLDINAFVMEDGIANYDIIKGTEEVETGETTDVRDEYVILLEEYDFTDADLLYDNRSTGIYINIEGLDHSGNGTLSDKQYDLNTKTSAKTVDITFEGIRYLQNADAEIEANFDIQDDFRQYNLNENNIRLNQLNLTAEGQVHLPEDGVDMDIAYRSTKTDLKTILSLIPSEFMPDLAGVKTSGGIDLRGEVKGHYDDNTLPGFSVLANISNGVVDYPDLPESITDINVDGGLTFPGGTDFNSMVVDIPTIHLKVAESPISGDFQLKTPLSDPYMATTIKAQVNLDNVKKALPLESVQELAGIITADVDMKGHLSTIEKERYEDFDAKGSVILQDFDYASDSLPVPISINMAHLDVDPRFMELAQIDAQFGNSDVKGNGRIENYLAFALKDEVLKGNFTLTSTSMDLNEWMTDETAPSSEAEKGSGQQDADTEELGVIPVPANVDIGLDARIQRLVYEDIDIQNVNGRIAIKDEVADLQGVTMDLLGGTVTLTGAYDTHEKKEPKFDIDFKIAGLDVPETFSTFNTIQVLAPIAGLAKGDFNAGFRLSTLLDGTMAPIFSSMGGGGQLTSDNLTMENVRPLMKIADALKQDDWKSQTLKNVRMQFEFEDGKVKVKPFDVKLEGMQANVSGWTDFAQNIDYDVKMDVPMAKLGSQANEILSGALGKVNDLGLDLSMGETVKMLFKVTGTFADPIIRPTILGQEGASIKDAIVDKVKTTVDSVKTAKIEEGKEALRAEADKLIADAQEQGNKLVLEAKKAGDRLRSEADKSATKLESEASGPIARIAAKKGAEKIRSAADDQANSLVDKARQQRTSLVDKAKAQAAEMLK